MRVSLFQVALLLVLVAGCTIRPAAPSTARGVEVLDERTGMTLATLKDPIELLPSVQRASVTFGKRSSFVYLGPVEWNRMGTISYGLWVHIAPGSDKQAGDIHAPGAVTLVLDDGPLILSPIAAPGFGRDAYQTVVSWGQTTYFDLTVDMIRRMSASRKIELEVRAQDDSVLDFTSDKDSRTLLNGYMVGRDITAD
jgi:hypothetical protein